MKKLSKKSPVTIGLNPNNNSHYTPLEKDPTMSVIRLDQEVLAFNNGYLAKRNKSAFVTIPTEVAEELNAGDTLPGQIVKLVSRKPFYTKSDGTPQDSVVYPESHDKAGEIVLYKGAPYFIQFIYDENSVLEDTLMESR